MLRTILHLLIFLFPFLLKGQSDNWLPYWVDDLWGFADRELNVQIKPEYTNAFPFSGELAPAQKNGKWGFINAQNEIVHEFRYVDVTAFQDGASIAYREDTVDLIGDDGRLLLSLEQNTPENFRLDRIAGGFLRMSQVLKDPKGLSYVKPYKRHGDEDPGLENEYYADAAGLEKTYWGAYCIESGIQIPLEYDELLVFPNGNVKVAKYRKRTESEADGRMHKALKVIRDYGLIDGKGKVILPLEFQEISFLEGPYWAAGKYLGDKKLFDYEPHDKVTYALYSDKGKALSQMKYHEIGVHQWDLEKVFEDKMCRVAIKNEDDKALYGYLDLKGNEVVAPQYDNAEYFVNGYAEVGMGAGPNRTYGLIDSKGKVVFPLERRMIMGPHEGLLCIQKGNGFAFINLDGELVIPAVQGYVLESKIEYGMFVLQRGRRFGLIGRKAEILYPFQMSTLKIIGPNYAYGEGLGGVLLLERGAEGKFEVRARCEEIEMIAPGIVNLFYNRERQRLFFAISGREIMFNAVHIETLSSDFVEIKTEEGNYGVYGLDGRVVHEPAFGNVRWLPKQGLFKVRKGRDWVYMDEMGNVYAKDF